MPDALDLGTVPLALAGPFYCPTSNISAPGRAQILLREDSPSLHPPTESPSPTPSSALQRGSRGRGEGRMGVQVREKVPPQAPRLFSRTASDSAA